MTSVFSMLPEGIRKASTRKVRRRNHTTRATRIDFVHSQSHTANERAACGRGEVGAGIWVFGEAVMSGRPLRGPAKVGGKMRDSAPGLKGAPAPSRAQRGQHLGRVPFGLHLLEHVSDPALAIDDERRPQDALIAPAVHGFLAPGAVG